MIKTYLRKKKAKNELIKAFRQSGLFLKYSRNSKTYMVYPVIHSIKFKEKYKEYVFSLPVGVSPGFIDDHFVFRQVFGENIELKKAKNDKTFTLKVFKNGLPSILPYDISKSQALGDLKAPIVFGVDHTGEMVIADLQQYPHMLVSGLSGGGKSQFIKQMLLTMIKIKPADELQFVLADLKRADLTLFEGVAHVITVAKTIEQLEIAMFDIDKELDRRCDLLDQYKISHVHEILGDQSPTIIVVLEEYTLCSESKEVERIAKKIGNVGRAVSILLVVVIQRGSSDNMPSALKSQLSIRMSFRQPDKVNARVAGLEEAKDIALHERGRAVVEIETRKIIQTMFISTEDLKRELKGFYVQNKQKPVRGQNKASESILKEIDIFGVVEHE